MTFLSHAEMRVHSDVNTWVVHGRGRVGAWPRELSMASVVRLIPLTEIPQL